jgi:hypothetical protein
VWGRNVGFVDAKIIKLSGEAHASAAVLQSK